MYKRGIYDILAIFNQLLEDGKLTYPFAGIREEVSKPWGEIDQEFVVICSRCVGTYSLGLVSG